MKFLLLILGLCMASAVFGQDKPIPVSPQSYDEALAKRLGADERGMKAYILVVLKTGPKANSPKEELTKLFAGHMANIGRLVSEGKLVVAGPMEPNPKHYEGIFILNVKTAEEADALLATDPAVAGGALAYETYGWYGSAALQETVAIHRRIDKTSH